MPGAPLLLQADRGHAHRHLPDGDAGEPLAPDVVSAPARGAPGLTLPYRSRRVWVSSAVRLAGWGWWACLEDWDRGGRRGQRGMNVADVGRGERALRPGSVTVAERPLTW